VDGKLHCVQIAWPGRWFANERPKFRPFWWHGSVVEDKRDATGTLYRRNRYLDAQTGRFTQEDPIGLEGGLNAYGFANGDPISYSDPYGLSAGIHRCPPRCEITDWGGGGPEQSRGFGHVKKRHTGGRWGNQFVDMTDDALKHIISETVAGGRLVDAQVVRGERRLVFERAWRGIGTSGEQFARVVLSESGELLTAYPTRNAARATGLGAASSTATRWTMRTLARAALYVSVVGALVDVAISPTPAGSSSCRPACQE
jgi:RHS repeat-associated protein